MNVLRVPCVISIFCAVSLREINSICAVLEMKTCDFVQFLNG